MARQLDPIADHEHIVQPGRDLAVGDALNGQGASGIRGVGPAESTAASRWITGDAAPRAAG